MKKWIGIACLLISLGAAAQRTDSKELNEKIKKTTEEIQLQRERLDSMNKRMSENMVRQADSMNRAAMEKYNERNVQSILSWQRESNAKKKKEAFIRIGIGVLFLGVLIFGLLRRRKKPVA